MQFSGCADEARCRAEAKAEGVGKGVAFQTRSFSGGYGEGDPPVPIPNTEVKPLCVDGTWLVTARESRSLPDSMFLSSSMAEHSAVNRRVVGSSPTWGAKKLSALVVELIVFLFTITGQLRA